MRRTFLLKTVPDSHPGVSADRNKIQKATVPETGDLLELRAAARKCRSCSLYLRATQMVFGEGERGADLVLVGEQPGDKEDLAGAPFVGPAGTVVVRALAEIQIDRRKC